MTITKSAKIRANQLHRAEHRIVEGKTADHKAEYYYYMASQLIEDLKLEIREVSKQQKYLWQTLEEVIEQLKNKKESEE